MSCPSETRLQAFVDGELSSSEIAELSQHLDRCDECRTVIGVVQPVPLDDESTVERVGRYLLRRVLGKGGMGVVYEAVDPELDRVVALKVLRSDLGAHQERLLGEAQAMAKLSHPNVVTIHDVGRSGDRVFIVMALVHGVSLRHWLARETRSLPAILDAFEQAGDGLAAAHAAGLIHRDFKPENVFVANDGRVLVGDFGLAVGLDADTHGGEGSLAYMAPEQRAGAKVDARCDQYSWCLALEGAVRDVPAVPRWLAKLVARGTQIEPRDRFPSMHELLVAFRAGRRGSRARRLAVAVAIATTLSVVAFGAWSRLRDAPDLAQCRARDAEMSGLWNAEVASRTERAFMAVDSPLSSSAWRQVVATMAPYSESWRAAQRRICEAPRESDPVARSARERKTSCLAERLEIVRAVTTSLFHVDAHMLEQVPAMMQLLPRVSACEDAREVERLAPPPTAEKSAAVDATRKQIATASATITAGRYQDGLAVAGEAWNSANAVSYLPVLAEAYLWMGIAHGRLGHTRESEQALEQAASSASAGHAPEIAIRAWIQLMHFVGYEGKRYDDGVRYAEYAKAALESLPGAFELEAERLSWTRAMLLDRKRFDEALVVSRQELALVELRFGAEHRLSAAALDGLAGVLVGQCKAREALEPQEKACGILEKNLGATHPQLALCLGNLASIHANLGEHARALTTKRRALEMFERLPGHPNHVAMAHRNLVRSLLEMGRLPEAKAELEAAAALSRSQSDETAIVLLRGELHRREGKLTDALADHALIVTRTEGDAPARRIEPLLALAETELVAERWADAASHADRAANLARDVYGERSCRVAAPLIARAEALLGSGRSGDAGPVAERGRVLLEGAEVDPLMRARVEFDVARTLPTQERERAFRLAASSRATAARDDRDQKLVGRIDAWLAASR